MTEVRTATVEFLRGFISERLTAAAAEIFRVFEQTVAQYEEQLDRQRRLLQDTCKPEERLLTEPQQRVHQEEELLSDPQRNPGLDQEDPPKTEEEGQQLVLKQEADLCVWTPLYEEREPIREQLLSHSSQDQEGGLHVDAGSQRRPEVTANRRRSNNTDRRAASKSRRDAEAAKRPLTCDVCGKTFKYMCVMKNHYRIHTGERPYCCYTCGRRFSDSSTFRRHTNIHTGQRPHSCLICGKSFRRNTHLTSHMKTHTTIRPSRRRRRRPQPEACQQR